LAQSSPEILDLALSSSDHKFVTISSDKIIRLWSSLNNKIIKHTEPFKNQLNCVDFSNDGSSLIVSDEKGNIFII